MVASSNKSVPGKAIGMYKMGPSSYVNVGLWGPIQI